MTYQFQTVDLASPNTFQIANHTNLGIGAGYNSFLLSAWFTVGASNPSAAWSWLSTGLGGGINVNLTTTRLGYSTSGAAGTIGQGLGSVATALGSWVNVLVSIDVVGRHVQAYINDVPVTFGVEQWFTAPPIGVSANWLLQGTGCFGDFWFAPQGSFVDLTTTSNRRKFINADLTPADVGANGSTPFGVQPPVFLHCGVGHPASDFAANLGSGGAFTPNTLSLGTCGVMPPTVPSSDTVTVGDLWYGPTTTFVDLRASDNRRLFLGVDGSTQYLGADGSRPTGTAPPIFLTLSAGENADDWALNRGTGGAFTLAGPDLQIATGIPPCSTYSIDGNVPPNTPQGADPQIRLSVSDDGGRTFSLLQKWRSMGKIGEYTKRLRWLKMGMFRERQIRLEVTDPVRRNIVGLYLDVTEGLD